MKTHLSSVSLPALIAVLGKGGLFGDLQGQEGSSLEPPNQATLWPMIVHHELSKTVGRCSNLQGGGEVARIMHQSKRGLPGRVQVLQDIAWGLGSLPAADSLQSPKAPTLQLRFS